MDFHAEATSEKIAMGWHLDGKVTAVVGTHTHVQTADERILPKGTAYLTDVGMTGPHDSVIGVEIEAALGKFLNGMPARFDTATENPRLNAVVIDADEQTGRATDIERLSYGLEELKDLGTDLFDLPSEVTTTMSDLFDLPFEEDEPEPEPAPTTNDRSPRRRPPRPDRHRAHRPRPRSAREANSPRSGSRASCPTAASGTPATVLHAEGRRHRRSAA